MLSTNLVYEIYTGNRYFLGLMTKKRPLFLTLGGYLIYVILKGVCSWQTFADKRMQ